MNLTDLQVELRAIEEQIEKLHLEIERMKPQSEEEQKADFEAITNLAKQHKISNLSIASASEALRKQFVSGLSYLSLAEEVDIYERLLYLCRISVGCGLEWSAEKIYKAGLEFVYQDLKELCVDLQEYKYSFLVEAFMIANFSGEVSEEALTLVADLAKLMECDEEEVRVIGQVAKSRLVDNPELLKQIPRPSRNRWSAKFTGYIPEDWLVEQRICCDVICVDKYTRELGGIFGIDPKTGLPSHFKDVKNHPCTIKDRLPSGSVVQAGDTLLTYEEADNEVKTNTSYSWVSMFGVQRSDEHADNKKPKKKSINAPCDGVLFLVDDERIGDLPHQKDKYIVVYVVSYFDEYTAFCKWYAEQNK